MTPPATRHNVRATLARPGFRRLLAARLVSQVADGWFQAGLASSVFFNPERATDAFGIVAGFAVLLLPYSVLGPFVGVFLDRWSRRGSLAVANLIRAALVVPTALCIWLGSFNAVFLIGALLVIALNRFFLAGVTASHPHVVDNPRLVTANSFAATAGTVCYTVSLGMGGFVIQLFHTSATYHYALVSLVGTLGYLAAALMLFGWFRPEALGPDDARRRATSVLSGVADTARGMVAGLLHLGRRPRAAAVLVTQAAHRMLFGVLSIMTLLLYRNYFRPDDPDAAIVGLIAVAAAAALGALTAALITPPLVRRLGAARWLVLLSTGAGVVVPAVGLPFIPSLTVVAAFATSLAAQGTKIVTDTTLQLEVDDDFRGRVFSVNDTGFNLLYVAGLLVGAAVLPPTGVSTAVMVCAGLGYLVVALGYGLASRRFRA